VLDTAASWIDSPPRDLANGTHAAAYVRTLNADTAATDVST